MAKQTPADGSKPLVGLDFAGARVRAEPFVFVLNQQLFDRRFTHAVRVNDRGGAESECGKHSHERDRPGDGNSIGEHDVVFEDVGKCRISICALERSRRKLAIPSASRKERGSTSAWVHCTHNHLVHQNAEGPPVNSGSVTTSLDDLWSDILLGPDKRVCAKVRDARSGVDHHCLKPSA